MSNAVGGTRGALWLVCGVLAVGCSRPQPPAPPSPEAQTQAQAQAALPSPGPAPARGPEEAGAPASPRPGSEAPSEGEWTAGILEVRRPQGLRPVTQQAVRAARHEGFDRVVFEFEGEQLPGYHVEYIDSPVRRCGSGDPTEVAGQGWLQVRLTPAQAHEDGEVTVAHREFQPGLPVLRELELTCDFEGEVTWVLGNRAPQPYRVLELTQPARLVVDVRH